MIYKLIIITVRISVINFFAEQIELISAVKVDLTISPTEKEDLKNLTYT